MKLTISNQDTVNYSKVAELFAITYPDQSNRFTADYFECRYKRYFSGPTRIISVFDEEILIGHAVIFEHHAYWGKKKLRVAQLGDLATHPQHRSLKLVREIYSNLAVLKSEVGFDLCITVPNDKSVSLNKRFLKLSTFAELPFYLGLASVHRHWGSRCASMPISAAHEEYCASKDEASGFQFSRALSTIKNRCAGTNDPAFIHIDGGARLITRAKRMIGIPFFIILTAMPSKDKKQPDLSPLIAHAARFHKTPIFVTWGMGRQFERVLTSSAYSHVLSKKMTVQIEDNNSVLNSQSTIELIDLDIDF